MVDSQVKCIKERLTNCPTSPFLMSLVSSFPSEWQGVFGMLNSERLPLYSASNWLKERISDKSKKSIPPHWTNLLNHLLSPFPIVNIDEIYFKPKFFLFPINLQRNILTFIIYHFEDIQLEVVENLVRVLDKLASDFCDWVGILHEILKARVLTIKLNQTSYNVNGSRQDNSHRKRYVRVYTETMSKKSQPKFNKICKKLLTKTTSESCLDFRNFQWLSVNSRFVQSSWNGKENEGLLNSDNGLSNKMKKDLSVSMTSPKVQTIDVETLPINEATEAIAKEPQRELICIDDHDDDEVVDNTRNNVGKGDKEIPVLKKFKAMDNSESSVSANLSVPQPPNSIADDDLEQEAIEEASSLNAFFMSTVKPLMENIKNIDNGREPADSSQLSEQISNLFDCSSTEMEVACQYLGLSSLSEQTAVILCQQFVCMDSEISYSNTLILASQLILPKLERLGQPASRVFLSSIMAFAKKVPRAFSDVVVKDLLAKDKLGTFQTDVICKVVKDAFGLESFKYFLISVLELHKSSPNLLWSENIVAIVQTIIDNKVDIDPSVFQLFSQTLELNSLHLSKSLKFSKLVLAIINKYSCLVTDHYKLFERILDNNTTFLKKPGHSALKKLSTGRLKYN